MKKCEHIYYFNNFKKNNTFNKIDKIFDSKKNQNFDILEYTPNTICKFYNFEEYRYDYCVILNDVFKNHNDILICPLESINNIKHDGFINVGYLPQINLNTQYVADIRRIRFISKNSLYTKDFKNSKEPYGKILDIFYDKILRVYLNLINEINLKSYTLIDPISFC